MWPTDAASITSTWGKKSFEFSCLGELATPVWASLWPPLRLVYDRAKDFGFLLYDSRVSSNIDFCDRPMVRRDVRAYEHDSARLGRLFNGALSAGGPPGQGESKEEVELE